MGYNKKGDTYNANFEENFGGKDISNISTDDLMRFYRDRYLTTNDADAADAYAQTFAALGMRNEDYQRSLATTQSSLMQAAGMSRAAALAALQGGGESSPAELSASGTVEQNRIARLQAGLQAGSQIATALGQLAFGGISAFQNKQLIDSNTYLTRFREQGDIALSPVMGMYYDASNSTVPQPSDNNVTDLSSFQEWCRTQPETSPYKTMVSSPEWRTLMATPSGADAAQRWFFGEQGPRGSVKAREDLINYTRQQRATSSLLEGQVSELGTNLEWLEDKYEDYQKLRDAANNEALQRLQNDLWELQQYADPVVRKQKLSEIRSNAEYKAIATELDRLKQSEFYSRYKNDPNMREYIATAMYLDDLGIQGTNLVGSITRDVVLAGGLIPEGLESIGDVAGEAADAVGLGGVADWFLNNMNDKAIVEFFKEMYSKLHETSPATLEKLKSAFGNTQTSNYTP